jgi:hypothetical protein
VDVLITPSDEISSLEVVAEDAGGRIVARARERGQDRALILCSATSAELSIAMRARGAQGLVAVVVGRSPSGAQPEISGAIPVERVTETRELTEARATHGRALEGQGLGAPKASTGTAKVGSRAAMPIDLPAGCARVDVLAGRPLAEFIAELWSDQGQWLAAERGGASAVLFACGAGGAARLDVEALARPGPFAIEVRKEPVAPAALVANPVAASRLLGRLVAGGGLGIGAASAAAAKVVTLEAGRQQSLPLQVPVQSCLEVIVALGAEGSGVDLRLFDSSTGESSLARGRYVASDRRCAGTSPAPGGIELRLAAGKGDALVLIRPAPRL